ncbi:MAG: histidine--tRNA ligase [Bdellovibrionales bacterium]|nr:histidine--tRNA ligase [Bdellovibrionales bacterium]
MNTTQKNYSLQPLRGMKDHLPSEQERYRQIQNICIQTAQCFRYQEVSTPLIENIEIFSKTVGEDIIGKELYQFKDKGDNSVALRPEGTAGIVRLALNANLLTSLPLRLCYHGPMFRYERPQKGRFRQFHQCGVEFFGEKSPQAELEIIQMADMILKKLNIQTKLLINTIGDEESRRHYKTALVQYLKPFQKELSPESQTRLLKNPLRILDSKSTQDKKILESAPLPKNFLNKNSKIFYDQVLSLLSKNNISCQQTDFLVRGLDYYSDTVFEFTSSELGAQNAVLAGGRYDQLIEMMGGRPCPAIGWACGLERLALLSSLESVQKLTVAVLSTSEELNDTAFKIASDLRFQGFIVYLPNMQNPFKKQMKTAHKASCSHVLILGTEEWKEGKIILKNMKTGQQTLLDKNLNHFKLSP